MSDSGVEVNGYREAQRALRNFDKEASKELQKAIRLEAVPVIAVAKANASWSATIPKSIALSVTQRGVGIKTRRSVAPVGALFERGGKGGGAWRHPLFGNTAHWYSQQRRPFIQPAVDAARVHLVARINGLMAAAARKAGL